jgi:hypothetical protein
MSKVIIVLSLSQTSDAKICTDCDNYTGNITTGVGLVNFSTPAVSAPVAANIAAQVGLVKTAVVNLRAAMAAPVSDTKTDTIHAARLVVDIDLTNLAHLIEGVANSSTILDANRAGIVHSAGMDVKDQPNPQKHTFTAKNGPTPDSAHLTAEGGANAHEWQQTTDVVTFTNRIPLESTTTAYTDVHGLAPKTDYAFFHKGIYPGNANVWEGPVFISTP